MKTFRITVPFSFMVSGNFEHTIDESDVVDAFGVDSLDQIDPEELQEYLRQEADDAAWSIDDDEIIQLVREQKGLETEPDGIEIETQETAE